MAYQLRQRLGLEEKDPNEVWREKQSALGIAPPPLFSPPSAPAPVTAGQPIQPYGTGGRDAYQGGAGWLNLQRYLGVNQGQGEKMANSLASGVASRGQALGATPTFGVDPAKVADAQKVGQDAKNLTDFAGRQQLFSGQGQGPNYSAGMGRWDSFLAGAAGNTALQKTSDQFGGLAGAFGLTPEPVATPEAPAPVAAPHQDTPTAEGYLYNMKKRRPPGGP